MARLVFGLVLLVVAFFLRLVPTEGGIPMLNIGDLRRNLRQQ